MNAPQPAKPAATKPAKQAGRKATADRFGVINGFVDVTLAELCRGDIAVWLVLYRDDRNGTALTSQADIGQRAGMSTRGVSQGAAAVREARGY